MTLLCAALTLVGALNDGTLDAVWADGRDAATLLDQKLVNRDLDAQLSGQDFRLGRDLGPFDVAADVAVGSQLFQPGQTQTRFHGFAFVDAYLGVRPLEGVEATLNVQALNPSASDGYRLSSQLYTGLALRLWFAGEVLGSPARLDFVAIDLDLVTLNQGLLLEQVPLEGHAAGVRWRDFELYEVFGGRVFWPDDDLQSFALRLWDTVELDYTLWLFSNVQPPAALILENPALAELPPPASVGAHYLTLGASRSFGPLRLAAEYGARVKEKLKHALLVRADVLSRSLSLLGRRVSGHVGYQFRLYERGFGPRDVLATGTSLPGVPAREDAYVTNSFEYFSTSRYFDQWSHTVMGEGRAELVGPLGAFVELEYLHRTVADRRAHERVLYVEGFGRAPASRGRLYYRAGIEAHPWAGLPHRLRAFVGNKFVASGFFVVAPEPRRFVRERLMVLEAEVQL